MYVVFDGPKHICCDFGLRIIWRIVCNLNKKLNSSLLFPRSVCRTITLKEVIHNTQERGGVVRMCTDE